MKQQFFLKLLLVSFISFGLASCGKSNKEGRMIPKEAGFVMRIDGKSLSEKLPWSEIKQNPIFQQMYGDSNLPASLKSFLDNPDNAGVDPASEFMLFSVTDSLGGYIGFQGNVKDEPAFKKFNGQATENGTASEKDGVQFIAKNQLCIGWTKKKFVYILDAPQMAKMDELSARMMRDSITPIEKSTRNINATCKAIFDLSESNTLAKNEHFSSLMNDKGDVQFWLNVEELNKNNQTNGALAMLNLDKFYKGNVTAGTLNFENGKIQVNMKSYASDDMLKLFKEYGGGKINEDMIKRIPGKDIVALMALNFKPEGIRELIKLTGMDGLINMGISKLGFTMDDFIKANKGDIVIGVSDLVFKTDSLATKQRSDTNVAIQTKPSFNFIFSAAIGDKDAFNKLVNAGKNLSKTPIMDSGKAPFAFNMNGTYFALSNSKENVDKYLGTEKTNFDFISKINGEPFGGYVNLQSVLKSFGSADLKDSAKTIAYEASLQMWENILWKGGNFKDGAVLQSMEVNLVDKATNSLKQMNQYSAKLAPVMKENHRKKKTESVALDGFPDPENKIDSNAVKSTN
ncbi:MAG: DUF4836 family protein [Ferruginibacter sp.]|nr:DUF4836 family protein [Ferruginibacter sp.]